MIRNIFKYLYYSILLHYHLFRLKWALRKCVSKHVKLYCRACTKLVLKGDKPGEGTNIGEGLLNANKDMHNLS